MGKLYIYMPSVCFSGGPFLVEQPIPSRGRSYRRMMMGRFGPWPCVDPPGRGREYQRAKLSFFEKCHAPHVSEFVCKQHVLAKENQS